MPPLSALTTADSETYLGFEVIALLLMCPTIHHVHNVVDGDGRLSNVGGQDDFPHTRRGPWEDALLVHHWDVGMDY